jgi:alkylation response protein AidB-like acyl-CoA dehydrogenase
MIFLGVYVVVGILPREEHDMYGFEPDEEQRMLVEAVERFAENDLRPAAREADEEGGLSPKIIEKGWELGVLQASIPEAYGGFGEHSAVTGALAAEAMAWGDLAGALAVMSPATYALSVLMGGTEEQKQELIPPVIEAEWQPCAVAFLEPRFDFNPLAMGTKADANGGGYLLNGKKTMVPFADQAEKILTFAELEGKTSAFVVEANSEGVSIGEREKLLGIHSLPTFPVAFDQVKLDIKSKLGDDREFSPEPILAGMQVAIAAMAVGLSKAALDYAMPYAKEREVWGIPIAQKQSIAFMLAEMAIEIESIRMLVWEAAWLLDEGKDASKAAYLALIGAADMAMMVTDRAVQVLGGHGYVREHPVEMWMRNGRGIPTFAGMALV